MGAGCGLEWKNGVQSLVHLLLNVSNFLMVIEVIILLLNISYDF